jgi:hypothetical protein
VVRIGGFYPKEVLKLPKNGQKLIGIKSGMKITGEFYPLR